MQKGHEIARGKTKILHELVGQPDVLIVSQLDTISARDGERTDTIEGKGRIAAKTTARVFRLLNLCGVPTHYLSGGEDDDDNAGSLVKRKPGIARGAVLSPRLIEFFLKDDANHDPLIEADAIIARGIATPQEVATMTELARIVFEILAHAWRRRETLLVDLKIEFGRLASGEGKGSLVVADVIDNDSWRIWPQGREELMLDKQVYRNLETVTAGDLLALRDTYEKVAESVGTFPQMRAGMVAILADGQQHAALTSETARAIGQFGLPSVRHVVSVERTPGFLLQLLAQIEVTFPRLVLVGIGEPGSAIFGMLDHLSPNPVVRVHAGAPALETAAFAVAKALAMDDTVVFGRVLLLQTNVKSAILQADAQLNATPIGPAVG
jgi:phosphoribosylaminoimidazole-succinocarboxamide synthase